MQSAQKCYITVIGHKDKQQFVVRLFTVRNKTTYVYYHIDDAVFTLTAGYRSTTNLHKLCGLKVICFVLHKEWMKPLIQ